MESIESAGYLVVRSICISRNAFFLPVGGYIESWLVECLTKASCRVSMNALWYSLAFGSAAAKVVAEPVTSRVARVRKCMIAR